MYLLDAWTSKDTVNILLGFFLGGAASFCAWWVVTHGIVPALAFSVHISKVPKRENAALSTYRFKFRNKGRRSIIDVELFARLYVKLSPTASTYQVIPLELSQTRFPSLRAHGKDKLISILPGETKYFGRANYPEPIRTAYGAGTLSLEQVLSMDGNVVLEVIGFGFDSFSGARKCWQQSYSLQSIKAGPFQKASLEVKETPAQTAPKAPEAEATPAAEDPAD